MSDVGTGRERVGRLVQQLNYLPFALGLVRDAAPGWTIVWLILIVFQAILPVATVYLTRALVDGLVFATTETVTWESFRPIALPLVAMALILIAAESLRSLSAYVRTVQAERIRDHIAGLVHTQAMRVDLAFYDSPTYYDRLHRARFEASSRPLALLENIGSLLQNALTMLGMLLVLFPYAWWLPLVLIVSTLPAFYVVLHERLRLHRWHMRSTTLERRAYYYFWLLTARESAAELRLFDLGPYFRERFQSVRQQLRGERVELARRQGVAELLAGLSALVVTALAVVWMILQTLRGLYTLGDLALFYQAFSQGQKIVQTLLRNVSEIYANSLFLGDLQEFLTLEPTVSAPQLPEPIPANSGLEIRFREVTFQYPDSRRTALDALNLTVDAGTTAAVVGVNGAGKSTLVKLLCRLYDPEQGSISIGGIDLCDLDPVELRKMTTVLMQEPVRYNATAADNIGLGQLAQLENLEAIERAAVDAGADEPIKRLADGYATHLGKWFEKGADLSVGEWQRVALARAYLRQAPIMILDEPTSAMDPWAESDWLRRFQRLAAGRTAIIITHRFTTAMYADVIHVMDGGKIVESGTHGRLLAIGGQYARSWREQMQEATPG